MGEKADPKIADFLQKVRKKYNISQAIFFGSRARGEHLNDSDYEAKKNQIGIVSEAIKEGILL